MRTPLLLALAALVAPVGGCDVLAAAAVEVAGAEVRAGVPADFPLPVPQDAVVTGAVDVRVAGVRTTTVQLVPPPSIDDDALLDACARAMEAHGLAVTRSDLPTGRGLAARDREGRAMTATLGIERGRRTLTLVTIAR